MNRPNWRDMPPCEALDRIVADVAGHNNRYAGVRPYSLSVDCALSLWEKLIGELTRTPTGWVGMTSSWPNHDRPQEWVASSAAEAICKSYLAYKEDVGILEQRSFEW